MTEGFAAANGIRIAYEDLGPRDGPVILLVMGLGAQLVFWPKALVAGLVARGFRVVRFDNRDIGLSTHMDGPPPSRLRLVAAMFGLPVRMPYTLRDMARDAVGLLDALGIAKAHVVGASMGGMIAQTLAAEHAGRVLTLTSIMSSSGRRGLPGPTAELRAMMLGPRPVGNREAAIEAGVRLLVAMGAPGAGSRDVEERRAVVAASYDRNYDPAGTARQFGAILADGSRVARLGRIRVPTLVIHGASDPLVPLAAGKDTAANVLGARLEVLDGMGHDLPSTLLPRLVELIADHAGAVPG